MKVCTMPSMEAFDRRCGVIDDLVVQVRRKQRFTLAQGLVDRFGRLELVCPRQEIDGHVPDGLPSSRPKES